MSKLIASVVAILATIAVMQIISTETSPSSFLYRLFRPETSRFVKLVPIAITVLFFWTIVDLLLKWLQIKIEHRRLHRPTIIELPLKVAREGIDGAIRSLSRPAQRSPTIRCLLTLLELLAATGNVQRAHEVFRHQTDLAEEASVAAYSSARVFIWAMPILGFIGTVLGIGLAVGNFSGFLTGDIDNVDLVKKELAKIASGLSYAFDTTLLGLMGSLPSMLLMSVVQKSDETVNSTLESFGLTILASFPDTSVATPPMVLNEPLLQRVDAGLSALQQRYSGLLESLSLLDRSSIELTNAITGVIDNQNKLQTGVQFVSEALQTVRPSIEEAGQYFRESTNRLTEGVERLVERVDELIQENRDVQSLGIHAQRLGKQVSDIARVQAETASAISVIRQPFENIILRFERLEADKEDVNAMGQLLQRLAEQIVEIEKLQKESLGIVSQLQEPFEFRLVPKTSQLHADGTQRPAE